jgi:hypothetical protein
MYNRRTGTVSTELAIPCDPGTDEKSNWISPVVAVAQRTTSSWKRPTQLSLDSTAPSCVVEGLGGRVLIEYPEVKRPFGPKSKEFPGRL